MKKTKCDGESPCKRCKDDGLVCTAGSRKKTEFKQLPRGYAEVLENTQYALIATVQKLYTMIRNGESWELGEPEMNDRGQPVIHDIASKLGCIRPSPDLPYAFPEGEADFAELQAQLQAAPHSDMGVEDSKHSQDSAYSSPSLDRNERASSSDSDSDHSADYDQQLWAQQQQQRQRAAKANPPSINTTFRPTPSKLAQRTNLVDEETKYSSRASFGASNSLPSPIYTEFATESPMFRTASPFTPSWSASAGDDFLGQAQGMDFTANYMRGQPQYQIPRSSPLLTRPVMDSQNTISKMQMFDGLPAMDFSDGTIRPNMLDYNTAYPTDTMDNIMFDQDFEMPMGMA